MSQAEINEAEIIESYEDVISNRQNVVALSKNFAKVLPYNKWNVTEMKLFFAFLENINWRQDKNGNISIWDNVELGKRLGWNVSTPAKVKEFSKYAVKTLKKMESESQISIRREGFDGEEAVVYSRLFFHIESTKNYTLVVFNNLLMPLFENLIKTKSYFTYWLDDIYMLDSKYGQILYLEFIKHSKHFGGDIDEVNFTTRQLKTIFNLSKEAYTSNGKFNRMNFERKTIERGLEEIVRSKLIELVPFEDGSFYKKEKNGKKVDKYKFRYRIRKELLQSEEGSYWYDKESFSEQQELQEIFRGKLTKKNKAKLEEEEPYFYGDGSRIKVKFESE